VLAAASGADALDLVQVRAGPIDVVVSDVVMPGLPGPELVARLEAKHPGVRALYMSGYTDDKIVHHGAREHGVSLLAKPFTPDELARRVREVLDTER
jgi:DNA-binding NarL/FixJ family response regulator